MHELTINVDTAIPNYPKVRLLIDGVDLLASTGDDEGNHPADILDTGALLPTDPPRRVAFYGCGCGEFGCSNVAGLITQRDHEVEWGDFVSLTGVYHSALADPEEYRDPEADHHLGLMPRRHNLPTLTFDTDQYRRTVSEAMADRSWETRPQAVVRHIRARRPDLWPYPTSHGDAVTLHHRADRMMTSTEVSLPPGDPEDLAERLLVLLDQGHRPEVIASGDLWR